MSSLVPPHPVNAPYTYTFVINIDQVDDLTGVPGFNEFFRRAALMSCDTRNFAMIAIATHPDTVDRLLNLNGRKIRLIGRASSFKRTKSNLLQLVHQSGSADNNAATDPYLLDLIERSGSIKLASSYLHETDLLSQKSVYNSWCERLELEWDAFDKKGKRVGRCVRSVMTV